MRERTERTGRRRVGLACSVPSIVPGFLVLWLGVPFVVAGAGVALGLAAVERGPARLGIAAVAVGGLAIVLGAGAYALAAVDKLA